MLTIIFVAVMFALLVLIGIFTMMARSNRRRNQSGSPNIPTQATQGRADGLN